MSPEIQNPRVHRTSPRASQPSHERNQKETTKELTQRFRHTTQRRRRPILRPNQNAQPSPLLRAFRPPAPFPRRPREPNRRPHHHPPHLNHKLHIALPPAATPRQPAQFPEHGNGHRTADLVHRSLRPPLPSPPPPLPGHVPRHPRARHPRIPDQEP